MTTVTGAPGQSREFQHSVYGFWLPILEVIVVVALVVTATVDGHVATPWSRLAPGGPSSSNPHRDETASTTAVPIHLCQPFDVEPRRVAR